MTTTAGATRAPFLRKITTKTVTDAAYGDGFLAKIGASRPVAARTLFDLFGQISRTKLGHTDKGDYIQFKGRFQAVTPDGEVFDSGAAHIPVLEDMLFTALTDAQASNPKAQLEIAIRIGIKPAPEGKPSATGYEFVVTKLLQDSDASDPIARLRSEVAAAALPAPGQTSADVPPAGEATPATGGKHHAGGKKR